MMLHGITVIRYEGRVKISVPNCGRMELVLWFICKTVNNITTSEFIIARGVNLQPILHGLVGEMIIKVNSPNYMQHF